MEIIAGFDGSDRRRRGWSLYNMSCHRSHLSRAAVSHLATWPEWRVGAWNEPHILQELDTEVGVAEQESNKKNLFVEFSWKVMAHGDAREGKWRRNWWMEWVASTLHTTSEHGVPSITTADAHTSAASRRLNWRPRRFKWTRPFRRKTKSCFCACANTFQTQSNTVGTQRRSEHRAFH